MVAAAVGNVLGEEPRFTERAVHYDGLSADLALRLEGNSKLIAGEALQALNRQAAAACESRSRRPLALELRRLRLPRGDAGRRCGARVHRRGASNLRSLSRRSLLRLLLSTVLAVPALRRAPGQPSDRGIGGTGFAPGDDRGIGGTGVIGTIQKFGSIVVNDLRISYAPDTDVRLDGRAATPADLRIGHVVRVAALGADGTYSTRAIDVTSEVVGPVARLAGRQMIVLGQTVSLAAIKAPKVKIGDVVAVSGLRRNDGIIVASLVERRPGAASRVAGPVDVAANGAALDRQADAFRRLARVDRAPRRARGPHGRRSLRRHPRRGRIEPVRKRPLAVAGKLRRAPRRHREPRVRLRRQRRRSPGLSRRSEPARRGDGDRRRDGQLFIDSVQAAGDCTARPPWAAQEAAAARAVGQARAAGGEAAPAARAAHPWISGETIAGPAPAAEHRPAGSVAAEREASVAALPEASAAAPAGSAALRVVWAALPVVWVAPVVRRAAVVRAGGIERRRLRSAREAR